MNATKKNRYRVSVAVTIVDQSTEGDDLETLFYFDQCTSGLSHLEVPNYYSVNARMVELYRHALEVVQSAVIELTPTHSGCEGHAVSNLDDKDLAPPSRMLD